MQEDKKITDIITADEPQNIFSTPQRPMLLPELPMMQQMQQTSKVPYPLIFFLFPRIAMFLMRRGDMSSGQRRIGVQSITQLVRDTSGRIIEIVEFIK